MNTPQRIYTNDGPVTIRFRKNGNGILDRAAHTCFTKGQCHSFAVSMHDKTGWPMIGIGSTTASPAHFIVYSPVIDDYIDIDGPGALERWEFLANRMIREFDRSEIPPIFYSELNLPLAEPFVNSVLEKINKLPVKHSTEKAQRYLNSYENLNRKHRN